jgi:hypothetical protein
MSTAKLDPNVLAHLEWIGFVRPIGLVVSAPALVRGGAILDRRDADGQRRLASCLESERPEDGDVLFVSDFRSFAESVLGWSFSPKGYVGTAESPIPPELEVLLTEYDETLAPDYAVREREPADGAPRWQLLVKVLDQGQELDRVTRGPGGLEAPPHGRMERLLRASGVQAGILFNGRTIRLISAPRGENSGWIDFHVSDMAQTAGRPILAALRLLVNEQRLLALPREQRFAALLDDSRRFQNEVSERLAEQVLHALYELLRGFQAAHDASGGELLRQPLTEHPDAVYRALLSVLLRLVFLLYAEERDMLPEDETYLQHYSLAGLYERLREDAAHFPDTMDQRFGAWAQLLVLFRLVHDGADAGGMHLPPRHSVLFDPDRFPFLEGRAGGGARQVGARIEVPLVPDGTIYRVLDKLLLLDGERISYRALDVEQIGSVYETMMGFRLETTTGRSVAVKAQKKRGAPTAVDLDALLAESGAERAKWLQDRTERKLPDNAKEELAEATTLEDLHAALLGVVDVAATPDIVPAGTMVLQPSEERRRSGSHYTPRSLTEPIVRTALEPILERIRGENGDPPTPEAILDLKVCDPAMGSGAFLVEACRQLGDALIDAWHSHDATLSIPGDEDEVVLARRLVAQRCLYGVDRNPVAVDLAKMSLWLVTLAREHALTFVDHALRHGDSLVGLSQAQIEAFNWDTSVSYESPFRDKMREQLKVAADLRQEIRGADETVSDGELRDLWDRAQFEISQLRLFGDLVTAAFFGGGNRQERETKRSAFVSAVADGTAGTYRAWLEGLRNDDPPLAPFHWEIEFTEVFEREDSGFDAIVGNPPFAGKNSVAAGNVEHYPQWLKELHEDSHGNADLVAHFFRRSFDLVKESGIVGLIATNTIAQGDTRSTGLRWICKHEGEIFSVRKRLKWPGMAAVVVSVLHLTKGAWTGSRWLDNREVEAITAFLFHRGGHDDPARLAANAGKSFQGSIVLGMGFTFDDTDTKGVATSLAEMRRLIQKDPRNEEMIFPYIGGEEVNVSPTHAHHRYVINFEDMSEDEAWKWPDLMTIVKHRVKPERDQLKDNTDGRWRKKHWWLWGRYTPALYKATSSLDCVLAVNCGATPNFGIAFLSSDVVFANTLAVFAYSTPGAFCALQSRPHETWARFFSSSMKDDLRYAPSDCFETFPFPDAWEDDTAMTDAGRAYHRFRATLMVENNEGLTKTYNRFHDPDERDPAIRKLRELHSLMDRALLNAYGWSDVPTDCVFLLDYEVDEDERGRNKKPWRYRWPNEVRDDVLARLLELNEARAAEEARAGAAGGPDRLFA